MHIKITNDQLSVLLCNAIEAHGIAHVLTEVAMSARASGIADMVASRIEGAATIDAMTPLGMPLPPMPSSITPRVLPPNVTLLRAPGVPSH